MQNVRTAHMCVRIVYNCRTQHNTQQFRLSSLLSSRQAPELRCCLLEGRGQVVKEFWQEATLQENGFFYGGNNMPHFCEYLRKTKPIKNCVCVCVHCVRYQYCSHWWIYRDLGKMT